MVKEKNRRLKILMNGELVGCLSSSSRGMRRFVYDESWLVHDKRRAVSLSLPLSSQAYSGQAVEDYSDNLLPDSQQIRNRLQSRVGATSTRAFDLLAHIGRD
jgi:serine/threonine-protein kinase HipA